MRIHVIAVGTRMPAWVETGYKEYSRRMPNHCRMELHEVAASKRPKGADIDRLLVQEGDRLLAAIPKRAYVIALERSGRRRDTAGMAALLRERMTAGDEPAFLIGGPEGLAPACLDRADETWSLSAMTQAHPVVRIVLAEQLYRAWTLLENRPYHR